MVDTKRRGVNWNADSVQSMLYSSMQSRHLTGFFSVCEYCPLCYAGRIVDYINTVLFDQYNDEYVINENTFVADGVRLGANQIKINESVWLNNDGVINADIYLCDDCDLMLINSGQVNGDFVLGKSASITRVISGDDNAVPMDIGVAYNLVVNDVYNLDLSDAISDKNIDKIIISDSVIGIERPCDADWEVHGDVVLRISDEFVVYNGLVLANVSGGGRVMIDVVDDNPLYSVQSYFVDDDLYLKQVRETDYAKILNSDVGIYLNSLRVQNPNDDLLSALDAATDLRQINEIMADSVRIAPFNMMEYVRVYNLYNVNNFGMGIGGGVNAIFGDGFNVYAGGVHGEIAIEDVTIWGAFNVGRMDADMRYENFDADLYAAAVGMAYQNDSFFVRSNLGVVLSKFNLENILDGNVIIDNPVGWSTALNVQAGCKYVYDDFVLKPYVGVYADSVSMLNNTDFDFRSLAGTEVAYGFEMLGIEYKYGVRLDVNTDINVGAGLWAEFLSPWDSIGGRLSIMTIDENKTGRSFNVCADVKFIF